MFFFFNVHVLYEPDVSYSNWTTVQWVWPNVLFKIITCNNKLIAKRTDIRVVSIPVRLYPYQQTVYPTCEYRLSMGIPTQP